MWKQLKSIALCAALCGCQTTSQANSPGPFPIDYKEIVRKNVLSTFKDPYSMMDSAISEPRQPGGLLVGNGWVVCLKANAKNSYGGYTGLRTTFFVIRNGAIVLAEEDVFNLCTTASFIPWNPNENRPQPVQAIQPNSKYKDPSSTRY